MDLDLPDALLQQIELRAAREGRPVHSLLVDLLNTLVTSKPAESGHDTALVPKTLPLIKVRPAVPDAKKLTTQEWCDWMKELDLQLEVERYEKALGHEWHFHVHFLLCHALMVVARR